VPVLNNGIHFVCPPCEHSCLCIVVLAEDALGFPHVLSRASQLSVESPDDKSFLFFMLRHVLQYEFPFRLMTWRMKCVMQRSSMKLYMNFICPMLQNKKTVSWYDMLHIIVLI
jgi:hypothetical protein